MECMRPTHAHGCGEPWHKRNGSGGWGGSYECWCNQTSKTVGREKRTSRHHHSSFPKDWPPQCITGDYYKPYSGYCINGTKYKALQGWSEASAMTMACKECGVDSNCTGWQLSEDGKSAELLQGSISYANCSDGLHSGWLYRHDHGGGGWFGVGGLGGYWYSMTTGGGECKNGAPVGTDGCKWRLVETKAYKNATCVDTHSDAAVEIYGKACFDTCPRPLNRTTDCYLNCYKNVLLGDASFNITKPPGSLIVDPWLKAILEDDPEKGGCPPVKPEPPTTTTTTNSTTITSTAPPSEPFVI
jgi:hypothetical protein